jgi:uncharacterized membrane protein
MDSKRRSIIKGVTWRALAMIDTIVLSLIFTGSIKTALYIGGLELVTKLVWYYLHERLWILIPATHDRYPHIEKWLGHNQKMRSGIKAISWRFFGSLDTFLIVLLLTRKVGLSGAIGGAEIFTKIVLYYLHDRAWSRVRWGKQAP